MDDLVRWLGEQLDKDAAEAQETANEYGAEWTAHPRTDSVSSDTGADVIDEPGAPVNHIAAHDPARVLRDIEARRRALNELLPELQQADRCIEGEWGSSSNLAERFVELLLAPYPECGARAVFWPEEEACDAECLWPRGHGGTRHKDEILGEWDEEELSTSYPSE